MAQGTAVARRTAWHAGPAGIGSGSCHPPARGCRRAQAPACPRAGPGLAADPRRRRESGALAVACRYGESTRVRVMSAGIAT